ncbi:MAG: hypothetical protein ABSD45_14160 [Terriglobia bacterium]
MVRRPVVGAPAPTALLGGASQTLARDDRIYVYDVALQLRGAGQGRRAAEGMEVFPTDDGLKAGEP